MRYLSVCSGIEAASVAWHRLGWQPVGFSEIEPFPSAVLAHHYPNVPNYGDMTKHEQWPIGPGSVDLLVGGTPCQSFSVAGLRKGLHDPRGGLMLTYLEIAQRLRPRWVVWENVPGVLSSGRGRDLGAFLGALGELGYGWAYRVLDAQWVRTHRHPRAVPQRRRRVFVVGCLGDGAAAAAVLFERESVQRDSAPRRTQGEGAAADAEGCAGTVSSKWSKGTGGPAGDECYNLTTQVSATIEARFGNSRNNHEECVMQPVAVDVADKLVAQNNQTTGSPTEVCAQPVASTLGNRGTRSHTELDGHGAYIPVAFGIYGGNKRQDRPEGGFYVREEDTARTLDAAQGLNPTCSQGGTAITHPVPYDLFQITAPVNRQNRKPGDPCHTLARDNAAHAAVVNMGGDKGGASVATDGSCFTLSTNEPHAVSVVDTDCYNGAITGDVAATMGTPGSSVNATGPTVMQSHGFYSTGGTHGFNQHPEVSPAVKVGSGLGIPSPPAVAQAMTVRRLTPRECERLQGFPDDWTMIPWRKKPAEDCPDGPRYKALGNSMAVNVMAWIGERIAGVEARSAGNP